MNNRTLSILRDKLDTLDKEDLDILSTEVKECLKFKEFKENGGCGNCGSQSCLGNYPYGHHCNKFHKYVKYPPLCIGDYVECVEFTSTDGRTLYGRGTIICPEGEEFGEDDKYWVSILTYGGPYKIKRKRHEIRKL